MRQILTIEATAGSSAIILDTASLAAMFGEVFAVNFNTITVNPTTFGAAVEYVLWMDKLGVEYDPKLSSETRHIFPFAQANPRCAITGSTLTGRLNQVVQPGFKTQFRFTTADIAPQTKPFSAMPVYNHMIIAWDADVDFDIEFDFSFLDEGWDYRGELMDLLANKRSVEDPNLSNTTGKRSVRRAGLRTVNE